MIVLAYFKHIKKNYPKIIILVLLYIILHMNLSGIPSNLLVNSSLAFQQNDIIGFGDVPFDHVEKDQSLISEFKDVGEIEFYNYSNFQLIAKNSVIEGLAKLEFRDIEKPIIHFSEYNYLNYIDKTSKLILYNDIFNNISISTSYYSDSIFAVKILLPAIYKLNMTKILIGLNLFEVNNVNNVQLNIFKFKDSINTKYGDNFTFINYYEDNLQILNINLDNIKLQLMLIYSIVFVILIALIYYMQTNINKDFSETIYLFNLRGYHSSKLINNFNLINVIFNALISIGIIILNFQNVTNFIQIDFLFVLLVSIIAFYSSKQVSSESIIDMEKNDIMNSVNHVSTTEIFLAAIILIVFLVNIKLNSQNNVVIDFMLIITTFTFIGFLILITQLLLVNKLYKKYLISYTNREYRYKITPIIIYFIKIKLRMSRKKKIISILIGLVTIMMITQITVISYEVDISRSPYGDIWASYDGQTPSKIDANIKYATLYPSSISIKGEIYNGLVATSSDILSIYSHLSSVQLNSFPSIWIKNNINLLNLISYKINYRIGDNIVDSFDSKIETFFDAAIPLPNDAEFLLFLNSEIISEYNETIFLVIDSQEEDLFAVKSKVEKELDTNVFWIQPPSVNIIDFSINSLTNSIFLLQREKVSLIFTLIIFIIAYYEINNQYSNEFEIMKIKGLKRSKLLKTGLYFHLLELLIFIPLLIMSIVIIQFLVIQYKILNNSPEFNLGLIAYSSFKFLVFRYLGQLLNWYKKIYLI